MTQAVDRKQAASGETVESVFEHIDTLRIEELPNAKASTLINLPPHAAGYAAAMEIGAADSIAGWILFATTAAFEAMLAVVDDDGHDDELDPDEELGERASRRRYAARCAFTMCLPPITSRRRAQAYIACVAVGMQHGWLNENQCRAMIYAAQMALAAHTGGGHKQRGAKR